MTINSVSFLRALHWLNAGWHYFSANIGAWFAMSLLFFISIAILIMIPAVGIFIMVLLLPIFFAGLLYAADRSEHGTSPQVEYIAFGFGLQPPRLNLFLLGALMLLYFLLLILALSPFSSAIFQSLYPIYNTGSYTTPEISLLTQGFLHQHPLILWAQLLILIGGFAAFAHAVPLTLFEGVNPLKAVQLSLQGFIHNLVPVSILLALSLLLAALATFAFGIGFLILLPVLVGANYASYREIFIAETKELATA